MLLVEDNAMSQCNALWPQQIPLLNWETFISKQINIDKEAQTENKFVDTLPTLSLFDALPTLSLSLSLSL